MPMNQTTERWFCFNCIRWVNLNEHLRCEICNSDQVVSEHGTRKKTLASDKKDRDKRD
jgi:hypothetical protein